MHKEYQKSQIMVFDTLLYHVNHYVSSVKKMIHDETENVSHFV